MKSTVPKIMKRIGFNKSYGWLMQYSVGLAWKYLKLKNRKHFFWALKQMILITRRRVLAERGRFYYSTDWIYNLFLN